MMGDHLELEDVKSSDSEDEAVAADAQEVPTDSISTQALSSSTHDFTQQFFSSPCALGPRCLFPEQLTKFDYIHVPFCSSMCKLEAEVLQVERSEEPTMLCALGPHCLFPEQLTRFDCTHAPFCSSMCKLEAEVLKADFGED
jgi:hypothetical protein